MIALWLTWSLLDYESNQVIFFVIKNERVTMEMRGIEPRTTRMRSGRSTTELHTPCNLPLSPSVHNLAELEVAFLVNCCT